MDAVCRATGLGARTPTIAAPAPLDWIIARFGGGKAGPPATAAEPEPARTHQPA